MNVEEIYVIERLEGDQWRFLYSDSDHEVKGSTLCAFMDPAEASAYHEHLAYVNKELGFQFRIVTAAVLRIAPEAWAMHAS